MANRPSSNQERSLIPTPPTDPVALRTEPQLSVQLHRLLRRPLELRRLVLMLIASLLVPALLLRLPCDHLANRKMYWLQHYLAQQNHSSTHLTLSVTPRKDFVLVYRDHTFYLSSFGIGRYIMRSSNHLTR